MLPEKIAFVDIETTGARHQSDRIIEIGILRIENNTLVRTFETLINPQTYISPFIEQMTGITKDAVESAPTFADVKGEILEILDDCVFVAHNVRFDYGFLRSELERYNIRYTAKHFCTVKLSRTLFPRYKRHNLDALIQRFHFSCERRHRAFDDAKVLFSFYQHLQNTFSHEQLTEAVDRVMKKVYLPIHISPETVEQLPQSPGVYLFYGENGMPLYIGKSKNIKQRVLSHFSKDLSSSIERKIAEQITRIDYIETAGELGALFKEAMLIKQLQPLYNKKQRLTKKIIVLKKHIDPNGYHTVQIELRTEIAAHEIDDILGVFRSQKQAKDALLELAKQHNLCQRILGLEKTKGACFGYHLGWCKGACLQKETPLFYNIRLQQAFSTLRIKPWPFNGPILIKEESIFTKTTEGFLVDKWCLLGSMTYDEHTHDMNTPQQLEHPYLFDWDAYTILRRFLKAPQNKQLIHMLPTQDLSSPPLFISCSRNTFFVLFLFSFFSYIFLL